MRRLKLFRYYDNGVLTRGVLLYGKRWVADTLERPWQDNKDFVSCVPVGEYKISYVESYITKKGKYLGQVYKVLDVKDRDGILVHALNEVEETTGCIGVGIKSGVKVLESKNILASMVNIFGKEDGILEILNLWDFIYE